jgi:putative endonuclease
MHRAWEHKTKALPGFTSNFRVCILVYFESYGNVHNAIAREKQIKRWRRDKKIALIESVNRDWKDLAAEWFPELKGCKALSLDSD